MNWDKILSILKIPTKVLIPALWIFSGFLLLANESVLNKLYLLQWSQTYGFTFGLIFLICTSLIAVYVFFFCKEHCLSFWEKKTLLKKAFKNIIELNDVEKVIIARIYTSKNFTERFDYNHPIIQNLVARGYLSFGVEQNFVGSRLSTQVPMDFTLTPRVIRALDEYLPKMEKEIENYKKKIISTKKETRKKNYQNILDNMTYHYELFMGIRLGENKNG